MAIDTSVLVPGFNPGDPRHRESQALLASVRDGKTRAAVSTVAASEALVHPLRLRRHDRIAAIQVFMLTTPSVRLIDVDWVVAFNAARLRADHGIQQPDAIIIASALGCDAFASADQRALAVAVAEGIEVLAF